ncbi:MAG: hypothetical protein HY327_04385 [Chloroflexi bacterium]|nr:hypothetical protein [Chloroflexota bacterium]
MKKIIRANKNRTARTLREIGALEDRYQVGATVSRANDQHLRAKYPLSRSRLLRVKMEILSGLGKQIAESETALRAQPNRETTFKLQRELIELNRVLLQIENLALDLRQDLAESGPFVPGKETEKAMVLAAGDIR